MIDRIQDVFRDVFANDELTISRGTDANDIKGWDSLNHINLVVALEDEFDVVLSAEEAASAADVGALMDVIDAKTS